MEKLFAGFFKKLPYTFYRYGQTYSNEFSIGLKNASTTRMCCYGVLCSIYGIIRQLATVKLNYLVVFAQMVQMGVDILLFPGRYLETHLIHHAVYQ